MCRLWIMVLALVMGAGLMAVPAMAQDSKDSVDGIQRGGGEGVDTALGKKGLEINTDGFALRVTTRVQFRLTYQNEVANGNNGTNGRDFVNFRVRRAVTSFSGHIFEKEFQYKLQMEWTGGTSMVEHAWFRWAIMQYINVTAGQQKLMYNWENNTSSGSQQFVDRGSVNTTFSQSYAKGINIDGQVGDDVPWLKYWFGVFNGVLRANNDFRNNDTPINSDTFSNLVDSEMLINLRLETHPLGEVKRGMNDMRGEDEHGKILFAIGLGLNWFMSGFNDAGIRADTVGTPTGSGRFRTSQDTLAVVLDGHFRMYGLSVDMELHYRHTEFHNRGRNRFNPTSPSHNGTANLSDMGISFLVAYFILPQQLNVGVRFDWINADEVWGGGEDSRRLGLRPDSTELGLSVNYYIHGDNLKLTFDVLMVSQQLPQSLSSTGLRGAYNTPPARSAGSIANESADFNDLWIMRLQLQWIF
ncbi:MAG: hypothetical protein IT464_06735 [Planctomycetes bacterium]|nr:hypothetical protein [Planctomycetota bacterium]